ncbi:MAG TPA: hypothetical protein VFA11_13165 [Acidimicrobiales bacterium]|nr:hypothetical protein [Acidimicrobiales bacterium]
MQQRRNGEDSDLVRLEDGRIIIQLPDDGADEPEWLIQARADLEGRTTRR